MTKAERAAIQPYLNMIALKEGRDYSWNESNDLRFHCYEKAQTFAAKLARKGCPVELEWEPELLHWTMPHCRVSVSRQ